MTLQEAFEKYSDNQLMRRASYKDLFPSHYDQALVQSFLEKGLGAYPIYWLKQLIGWGNEESRKMGFIIPQSMIDDANANDWEIIEDLK